MREPAALAGIDDLRERLKAWETSVEVPDDDAEDRMVRAVREHFAVQVLLREARDAGILTSERTPELIDVVASDRAALRSTLTKLEHAARSAFEPVREEAWKVGVRALLTRIRSLHIAISTGGELPESPPSVLRSPPPPMADFDASILPRAR